MGFTTGVKLGSIRIEKLFEVNYPVLTKVLQYIREHKLITPGDLVVAGISGGPDSMALLYILLQLRDRLNFKLAAAHLNHGLRPEAADEEKFVCDYCQNMQIPFYSRRLDVQEIAARGKKSLVTAATSILPSWPLSWEQLVLPLPTTAMITPRPCY